MASEHDPERGAVERSSADATVTHDGETPMVDLSDADVSWKRFFPYESAYTDQHTGIETFLDILEQNGFYALEGPCGTGKTLIAVTAALEAMRSDDYPTYSRAVVVTPNKQQLRQFIDEMRGVSNSLASALDPVDTVVLKGKTDMMPYSFVELPPFDRKGISEGADDLRKRTRDIIAFGSDIPLDWPDEMSPPASAHHDYDWSKASTQAEKRREATPYDPIRAKAVRKILISKQKHDDDYEQLVVDGVETPFPDVVPHTRHIVDTDALEQMGLQQLAPGDSGKFDPFYASFFATGYPSFGFDDADGNVLDRETLFELAASEGVCPHEAMADFARDADVVLGNYNHLFDPRTRRLTDSKIGLFDEETIIVADEAHRLEGRVRGMLSTSLDIYTLDKAIADLRIATAYARGEVSNTPTPELDSDELEQAVECATTALDEVPFDDVGPADLEAVEELLRFIKQKLTELAADHLQEAYPGGWQRHVEHNGPTEEEKPLTNVELPEADGLLIRQVKSRFDNGEELMETAYGVFWALDILFESLDDAGIYEREPQGVEIGKFCYDWATRNVVDYHRELILEPSRKENVPTEYPSWVRAWTPKFQLFNCIPTEPLQHIFAEVGGGILMSATLSPSEAFVQAVGIDSVAPHNELTNASEDARPWAFDQFELRFPEENRLSAVVDLPKYTAKNRGSITTNEEGMTHIRRQYAETILTIAESEGNVLICLPKYAEAKWAYEWTKDRTSKQLFLDQSSTTEETNELLDDFFDDSTDSVVFTSTRGTITEGVDYDGSKLHCCAVVGIPLIDTRSERIKAVKYAYSKRVDTADGFETAIKIPAVRKSRQAIGRVIRGTDDVGVRLFVDERYGSEEWDGAKSNLSPDEQREFETVAPESLSETLDGFWSSVDRQQTAKARADVTAQNEPADDASLDENSRESVDLDEQTDATDSDDAPRDLDTLRDGLKAPSAYTKPDSESVAKLYLGSGAPLKGWVPLPKEVIEEAIAPLVLEHRLKNGDEGEAIQINSTKNVASLSGWDRVEKSVVLSEIVPVVEDYRFE